MGQVFYKGIDNLPRILKERNIRRFLLVCDGSFPFLDIRKQFECLDIPFVKFNDFRSNPLHDDADKGQRILEENSLEYIVAVGGGSAMDVAKCIKLDSGRDLTIIAIPTTAGTGSEA